ncbi:hypothetical protein PsorP6_006634 [Peronosclerospora sorghi]|uniref:Uncharacterized protein n=1 Tax=Peronosclerospora sorghi TaxID=230839 RepID=A0ACC0W5A9_9STRA|nr:hypothetical protein PsorP6_006634 [Peronosclerospora sorghi]
MTVLTVHYKGQRHSLSFSNHIPPTIADLQAQIQFKLNVEPEAQRLFQKRRRVNCSDVFEPLTDVCDCSEEAPPLFLVVGASAAAIHEMNLVQDTAEKERKIRESRRVVNISKRNRTLAAQTAMSTNYRFHTIEPLNNFSDKNKAQEILENLANDRGILAVMAKHKWSVGVLAEMPPDGKVGVDPVCVLGLNQNQGQKILLRLRTDDFRGFRKFLTIKKVLFHELSHNVHPKHDTNFYELMRQIEKESDALDWTKATGTALDSSRFIPHSYDNGNTQLKGGHRLGGTSERGRRLVRIQTAPVRTEPSERIPRSLPTDAMALEEKTLMGEQPPNDRERRLHDAVAQLYTRYRSERTSKSLALLQKIVSNLLREPTNATFRSIRKANALFQSQVATFPECLDFLQALGFEDHVETFVLTHEDPALLSMASAILETFLSRSPT